MMIFRRTAQISFHQTLHVHRPYRSRRFHLRASNTGGQGRASVIRSMDEHEDLWPLTQV